MGQCSNLSLSPTAGVNGCGGDCGPNAVCVVAQSSLSCACVDGFRGTTLPVIPGSCLGKYYQPFYCSLCAVKTLHYHCESVSKTVAIHHVMQSLLKMWMNAQSSSTTAVMMVCVSTHRAHSSVSADWGTQGMEWCAQVCQHVGGSFPTPHTPLLGIEWLSPKASSEQTRNRSLHFWCKWN